MELKELYLGTCECALASVAPWAEMPLRSLMDGDCFGLMDNPFPLTSAQVVHVGARDLDDAEEACLERSDISRITVEDVRTDAYTVVQAVEAIGCSNVYVHLDLDVLNPTEFPNTPLPVAGGLTAEELLTVLELLTPKTAGMGIFAYAPAGKRISLIERILKMGLALYPPNNERRIRAPSNTRARNDKL